MGDWAGREAPTGMAQLEVTHMKIHGNCHCGKISFTALVDPMDVTVCHCTDCQILSGAPFRASVRANREGVQIEGRATEYIKTANSGNQRIQGFCGTCGTNLYSMALNDRSVIGLRLGCIAERATLSPQRQVWGRSAIPWVKKLIDGNCHIEGPSSALQQPSHS